MQGEEHKRVNDVTPLRSCDDDIKKRKKKRKASCELSDEETPLLSTDCLHVHLLVFFTDNETHEEDVEEKSDDHYNFAEHSMKRLNINRERQSEITVKISIATSDIDREKRSSNSLFRLLENSSFIQMNERSFDYTSIVIGINSSPSPTVSM